MIVCTLPGAVWMGQCVYSMWVCVWVGSVPSVAAVQPVAQCVFIIFGPWVTVCSFSLPSVFLCPLPSLSCVKPTSKPSHSAQCALCSPHQTPLLSHLLWTEQRVFISKHSTGRDFEFLTRAGCYGCGVKEMEKERADCDSDCWLFSGLFSLKYSTERNG